MSKLYNGLMFALGALIGSILVVMSWGVLVIACACRQATGRWPEWLASQSAGEFKSPNQ